MAKSRIFATVRKALTRAITLEQNHAHKNWLAKLDSAIAENRLSRRHLMVQGSQWISSAVLMNAGLTAGCTHSSSGMHETIQGQKTFSESHISKIAVIGGGISGLTLAYRLSQNGIPTQVFEGNSTLGGRVSTMRNFNSQGMFMERGGEFVDTGHTELRQLCQELGVAVDPLTSSENSSYPDIHLVDGIIYSESQVIAAFKPLALKILKDQALLKDGDSLSVPTFDHSLSKNPQVIALDRTPLASYIEKSGIEPWAQKLISTAYMAEYGLDTQFQSALNLLILIDPNTASGRLKMYGESDEAFRIRGGSDTLTSVLGTKIKSKVPIYLEHKLVAISDETTHIRLVFDIKGHTRELKAEKVVLTLPPPVLASLDLKKLNFDPFVSKSIQTWGMGTNSKIMYGLRSRPWDIAKKSGSANLAPLGQCWDTSRAQPGTMGILTFFTGGHYGKKPPAHLSQLGMTEIAKVFPGVLAEFDGVVNVNHWAQNPWSWGSYSCPLVGQYTSIYGSFNQMQLNGKLFFAGEHASVDYAGYMNGAVNSAQRVADMIIKKRRLTRT